MALNDVLSLMIEDFDPEAFYDGEEQIVKEAVAAFYGNQSSYFDGEAPENVRESFRDAFVGWFVDVDDFARDIADRIGVDLVGLSWPLSYIDWECAGEELLMSDYWESDDGYYFRSN